VLLSESWPRLRDSYPAANDAAQFERAAAALHASARRQALAAVHSQRYALLVLRLARVATTAGWAAAVPETVPVSSFAKKLLDRRLKQVNNKGTRKRDASLDELHALRIAVKKLRYALEFFESLFPIERVKRLRGRLVALQDVLGEINDATTMRVMTTDALTRNRRFTNVVTGWTAHIIHDRREQHRECWRAFRRVRKFW
jgi:CHAD domain-containing protein